MKRSYKPFSAPSSEDESSSCSQSGGSVDAYNERPTKKRKLLASELELNLTGSCDLTPKLLRELSQLCPSLVSLNLSYCNYLTDEDVTLLLGAPGTFPVRNISLSHTSITDEGIKYIVRKCPQLTSINLQACYNLTDLSLSLIAQHCKNVSELVLSGCHLISDTGAQLVAQEAKSNLILLDLNECTRITDKTLGYLGYYCPNVSFLRLKNTSVTPAFLAKLLPRLRITELNVQGIPITDSFLFHLAHFQHATLRILDVGFCYHISIDGITRIVEEVNYLSDFSLFGLSLTNEEVSTLQSLHPNLSCNI